MTTPPLGLTSARAASAIRLYRSFPLVVAYPRIASCCWVHFGERFVRWIADCNVESIPVLVVEQDTRVDPNWWGVGVYELSVSEVADFLERGTFVYCAF